jgi:hypothetical protein
MADRAPLLLPVKLGSFATLAPPRSCCPASHVAVFDHELEFSLGLDLPITALELDLHPR